MCQGDVCFASCTRKYDQVYVIINLIWNRIHCSNLPDLHPSPIAREIMTSLMYMMIACTVYFAVTVMIEKMCDYRSTGTSYDISSSVSIILPGLLNVLQIWIRQKLIRTAIWSYCFHQRTWSLALSGEGRHDSVRCFTTLCEITKRVSQFILQYPFCRIPCVNN